MAERRSSRIENRGREKLLRHEAETIEKVDQRSAFRPNHILWSVSEKTSILKGMRLHGTRDVDALAKYCQFRTKESIEFFINKEKQNMTKVYREIPDKDFTMRTEVVVEKRSMDAPIEQWIKLSEEKVKCVRTECGHVLPKLLHCISEHELHPDPEDCGGIDYASVYNALALLMQGDVPPDSNIATSQRILDLFNSLQQKVAEVRDQISDQTDMLANCDYFDKRPRTKGRKERRGPLVDKYKNFDKLPGVNPLEIPKSAYDVAVVKVEPFHAP